MIMALYIAVFLVLLIGSLLNMPSPKIAQRHIWTCSMGREVFAKGSEGELRWCYRCLDWVSDPEGECPGSKSASCHGSRG